MENQKNWSEKLSNYLNLKGISGKSIAKKLNYSEAAISQYINGKSKDSKLDIVVQLFLELEELKKNNITNEQIERMKQTELALRFTITKKDGQIEELRQFLRDIQYKVDLKKDYIKELIKEIIEE